MVGVSHFLMTTHNSTISEPYKHFRMAKAFMVRQIAPCRKRHFWVWIRPGFQFGQRYHFDRHGQLALKQLRLSVLNEMHTNSYTGPFCTCMGTCVQVQTIIAILGKLN